MAPASQCRSALIPTAGVSAVQPLRRASSAILPTTSKLIQLTLLFVVARLAIISMVLSALTAMVPYQVVVLTVPQVICA